MRRLRERRAAAIGEDPDAAVLRDAAGLLGPAVEASLLALRLDGQDAAAAQLARQHARAIDQARDQARAVRWLGPLLLEVLGELGATPAARAKLKGTQAAVAGRA
jgi:sarcosine oxidase gamma subunit